MGPHRRGPVTACPRAGRGTPAVARGTGTLAIIAYHQPVTRARSRNRGVSTSKGTVDVLSNGWVRMRGRRGRRDAVTYGTTDAFLGISCWPLRIGTARGTEGTGLLAAPCPPGSPFPCRTIRRAWREEDPIEG
ncbi:SMC-Scp complex subunit ScpB [Stappia sp.]|uniref:SMC-Scp complex subunit ScpB n=1 Tax=Stappia sp. TaxID=1870903 RepID=UPI003A99813A